MFNNIKSTYRKFPQTFWTLIFASFIDQVGGALLFPFYALYCTSHFGATMSQVGIIFSFRAAGGIVGGLIGGALTDKLGRRSMLLAGILLSGAGSIIMTFIDDLEVFYFLAIFLGLTGNLGGPAHHAIVADILPPKQTAEGFGILRVFGNLAVTFGPILGGLLATKSYSLLFYADGIASLITAILVYYLIPETKPQAKEGEKNQSFGETMRGYIDVLKDWVYMLYLGVRILVMLVYMQMNSTLSVYLRDFHSFPEQNYSLLISMNALMVVCFQVIIARWITDKPPMKIMALGAFLYGVGFSMYGFVSDWYLFYIAMGIITIGEMITAPFSQSAVARFSPEDKRGRYMGMSGFFRAIPNMFGVLAAGVIMDHYRPELIWNFVGIIALFAMFGLLSLGTITQKRFAQSDVEDLE